MPIEETVQSFLTNPTVVGVWAAAVVVSLGILAWDIHENNAEMASLSVGSLLVVEPVTDQPRFDVAGRLALGYTRLN